MMKPQSKYSEIRMNRRSFIKSAIAFYGSFLLIPACTTEAKSCYTFTLTEVSNLEALCEQLIPTDEYPGAIDAGVINFIDRLLYTRFPEKKRIYQNGLNQLSVYSKQMHSTDFYQLETETQFETVKLLEKGQLAATDWQAASQSEFFETVLRHTMQGFYGSPRHGGNRNYVSYRMMKLDYPLLIGQNRYE